jgi:hypothetical protein
MAEDTTIEINGSINSLLHDIEVPLDIFASTADAEIYDRIKNEPIQNFSPQYLSFMLQSRRKKLYKYAARSEKNKEYLYLTNDVYSNFNFIEIALAIDMFPNLNSVTFIQEPLEENMEGVLTFSDDINKALNAKVRVSSLGVRLRDWFDAQTTNEINRQIAVHNEKFNNAMHKDNLMLINDVNSFFDVCASTFSAMGKNPNDKIPLFELVPKSMMEVPVFIFTDYLER